MEETKLKEWEILRANIKKLRKELQETDDADDKQELLTDIENLLQRKKIVQKF
jgi:hypothetical protein